MGKGLYHSTKQAARFAEVSEETVRRWERRGAIRVRRSWTGRRQFSQADLIRLRELAGHGE